MRFRIFFAVAFVAFSLGNAANFISTHGKLSVSGSKILNESAQEIVLRGMSFYWYNGPWPGGQPGNSFYTSSNVSSLANNWNANVVRAAIGNVQQNPSDALNMAKSMMDWANSAGVYVIIDNHSHIAHRPAHSTAAQNFFRDVSAYVKQKNYTHVIYEIYNEPLCDWDQANNTDSKCPQKTTWAQIKSYAETVISVIRTNDADGLIIIGTPSFSSDIASARANPINGRNLLYALHFYAGESAHSNYRSALEVAYCRDFPVFVSEWGTSPASGDGAVNTSNSNTWISLLEAAKVSYANWSLSNVGTSGALTGTSVNDSLTTSGNYVKNLFRLNTSGTSLSSVGLSEKTINCSSPPEPSGPDGRIMFGSNGSLANFESKTDADSVNANPWALVNTAPTFTADYTFIGIEKPGTYLLQFYVGATANGTVSWSGSGISSGQAQITSTGALNSYDYTEPELLTISEYPETPLYLSFSMPSANSLYAVYVYTSTASKEDSVKYDISPVIKSAMTAKHWSFDAVAKSFVFEKVGGTLAIYNLQGKREMFLPANGSVSIKQLPSATYIAVYKLGSETTKKLIHLR